MSKQMIKRKEIALKKKHIQKNDKKKRNSIKKKHLKKEDRRFKKSRIGGGGGGPL